MRRFHLVFLAAAVVALSCSDNTPVGSGDCNANDDCASGEVCDSGECVVLCVTDADCTNDEICTDSLCAPGTRATPAIAQIDGDGSEICPDGGGSHCVVAGLIVQGTNLEGASFELVAAAGASYPLTPTTVTDNLVTLEVPTSVGLGIHTLRAVNGAGSADQNFEFIQGPQGIQGIPGNDGSPDTGAEIMVKLQSVDGTGSGLDADTLDGSQLADIDASIAAATALMPPIGSIIGWHKDLTGVVALPDGWMECNGQQIVDLQSPLYLTYLPDLNSEVYAGGRGRYLRGGPASGVMNNSTRFGDNGGGPYQAGSGIYYGAAYHGILDAEGPSPDGVTYSQSTRLYFRFQTTAMTVVWIMRVK